jgi:hypothetical protein
MRTCQGVFERQPRKFMTHNNQMIDAVKDAEDVMPTAQGDTATPGPSTVDTDIAGWAADDGAAVLTMRIYDTTPRTISRAGRGVQGEDLVGRVGLEPTAKGL